MARSTRKPVEQVEYVNTFRFDTTDYIRPVTTNQARFVKSMKNHTYTIASGVAGCGKSLLALHTAVELVNNKNSPIERIVYIRPNVGVKDEDGIGFLKGTLLEKVWPLAAPAMDNLVEFMTEGQARAAFEYEKIVPVVVSLIRGRSLKNSFVIVDEAQNISVNGLKAVLTRIKEGSKLVIIGDIDQADLSSFDGKNGLADAFVRFQGLEDFAFIQFQKEDIQRHPMIAAILERY
jgi:phosphate starvation-inducible protein PhoH and related proteins